MLFFYAEGTEHCRTKGQTGFPPHQRAGVPADDGAGALITARGTRRPWGGCAYCVPRDAPTMGGRAYCVPRGAPTMGRAGLLKPEGRADHGAGALTASRGARRPWGGRACCSPRDAPTMGGRACCSPRDAPTMGGRAYCNPRGAPTMGGRAYHSPRGAPTMGGRACCSGAAAELAETFFRSCPLASCTKQVIRSAAARAEQENPARSKAYRTFARRKHGKAGG